MLKSSFVIFSYYYITVKSFYFVGTNFCGFMTLDMIGDIGFVDFKKYAILLKWISISFGSKCRGLPYPRSTPKLNVQQLSMIIQYYINTFKHICDRYASTKMIPFTNHMPITVQIWNDFTLLGITHLFETRFTLTQY